MPSRIYPPCSPKLRQARGLSSPAGESRLAVEYSKRDKYDRTVGKITVNGVDANLEQIKAGMAWHYKQYEREQSETDRITYAQAEGQARAAKRGLWLDPKPTPPWDWRHQWKRMK